MQADQQVKRDYISNLAKSVGPFATHILRYTSADSHCLRTVIEGLIHSHCFHGRRHRIPIENGVSSLDDIR